MDELKLDVNAVLIELANHGIDRYDQDGFEALVKIFHNYVLILRWDKLLRNGEKLNLSLTSESVAIEIQKLIEKLAL